MSPRFWKYLIVSSKRKKFVSMWVEIASELDDLPVEFSYAAICKNHNISRTTLWRHMEELKQDWHKLETNLEQTWNKGSFGFQGLTPNAGTKVKQSWNKTETKKKQAKPPKLETGEQTLPDQIIAYLNEKTDKKYRASNKQTQKDIAARIRDGYTLEDFQKVVDNKCAVWLNTEKSIYLRPQTLFGNKFDSYLNEVPQNPELFMHQKISNHATKTERYNRAFTEARTIDFGQFVETEEGDQGDS